MKRTLCIIMVALTGTAFAQLIPLKTVPLATGQQFLFHPAENGTIGGVSVALSDSLADPYHNPATGALMDGVRAFASPLYYGIGLDRGRNGGSVGRTFPLGMSFRTGDFFGGMIWARQNISFEDSPGFMGGIFPSFNSKPTNEYDNTYTFGMFGYAIPGTGFSIGASARWADLNAIEGVQYLYSNTFDLQQKGTIREYRLGVRGESEKGRVIEFLVAHQKTEMEHGRTRPIYYLWESSLASSYARDNVEEDQSHGYAFEAAYRQPVTSTLTAGAVLALDLKTYPKIPNYQLMNIPRDPGDSRAWNIGLGISSNNGKSILGLDVIYEPAFAETWAGGSHSADEPQTKGGVERADGESWIWF